MMLYIWLSGAFLFILFTCVSTDDGSIPDVFDFMAALLWPILAVGMILWYIFKE